MKTVEIEVFPRSSMTKNELNRFRAQGNVPAVLYGRHLKENLVLAFNALEFNKILNRYGRSSILSFKSKDSKLNGATALIKDVQRNNITDDFLNVDLLQIRQDEKISVMVAIDFVGEAPGVKQGGTLDVQRREVELKCLPNDIPEKITVDISALNLNEAIHLSDIKLSDKVEMLDDPSYTVISVKVPRVKEEEPAEAAEGEEGVEGAEGEQGSEGEAKDDADKKDADSEEKEEKSK